MSDATEAAYESRAELSDGRSGSARAQTRRPNSDAHTNMGGTEAWVSAIAGTILVGGALRRPSKSSLALAAVGAALLYRGSTRHCPAYAAAGIDRSKRKSGPDATGMITINRPAQEVYRFWRDLGNLPKFINVVDSVEEIDEKRSRWHTREVGGQSFSYEAEIIEDTPGNGIRWRSVSGSPIEMSGSVRFKPAPADRGTIVIGSLIFGRGEGDGIAGRIASPFAKYAIHQDLMRLKRLLETGEIPSTEGQSVGPRNRDAAATQLPHAKEGKLAAGEEPKGVNAS